jgi:hypothetical protein
LGARITAFEYNDTIYADDPINDFIPEANTGLSNPKLLATPGTPILSTNPLTSGSVASFNVVSTTPATGTTMFMDFNYGTTTNTATHKLYRTVQTSDGLPFGLSDSISIDVADLPPATYYWSTTARTDVTGYRSNSSAAYVWGGPNVTTYNTSTGNGGLNYNQTNPNSIVGLQAPVAGVSFSVASPGPTAPTLPVDVYSSATRNVPISIPGSGISATNYYPWYAGTSSTSAGTSGRNFYAFNSSGPYAPVNARILLVADGEDNWFTVNYVSFAAGAIATTQRMTVPGTYTMVSDFDCIIQVVSAYKVSGQAYYTALTDTLYTYYLTAETPTRVIAATQFSSSGSTAWDGAAVLVRNVTSGATLEIVNGALDVTKATKTF